MLGPLEVSRDGEPVPVPGGKTAELLVRLALEAGVAVRADRLIDDLWADAAVDTRRNTLQSKVARLRRALGDPSADRRVTTADTASQSTRPSRRVHGARRLRPRPPACSRPATTRAPPTQRA